MGINTRRVKSLNNSCEMCDVSVVKLYEQNDERLVPISGLFLLIIQNLFRFFHLHAQFLFLDLITICLLHMYHLTELKVIKVRYSTNVHFYSIITDDKNYDISSKYYGLFEESKGRKNAYYGKVQELTCTPNLEGYDPACRHKHVHN